MSLQVHYPYPGVALVVTERGSALLGAPTDAFKATKAYCQKHDLPFPRVLVAPPTLLVDAAPQFNPEFFLYDFLFVYGAAFKPELEGERLALVIDDQHVADEKRALRHTLVGPSRDEMAQFRDAKGEPTMSAASIERLANISEHMAIKKDGRARALDEMVETFTFDQQGRADLFEGDLVLVREGGNIFRARSGRAEQRIDLSVSGTIVPFATLPTPDDPQTPVTFGVKPLGTRSGFDLSGPTTGFLIWLNGRALIYDGPVETRYLLERQGIAFDDIAGVVLSHCHEDHMGAFVEMILAGHRPKVFTAEPIYRSALVKLSSAFNQPEEEVAKYIDFHRITPGEPVRELGATLDLFYTVHAIPTVGVRVSMKDARGTTHSVQISGDTMHHEGLEQMKADGVLSGETFDQMRHLVPNERNDDALYFADVGESLIHGHPKDWQENPNQVVYYHCPDNEHTQSFGKEIAMPGKAQTLIETPKLHPAVPGRLLSALRFLDIRDPAWLSALLFAGRMRKADVGELLAEAGHDGRDTFSVVVSGSASVSHDGDAVMLLKPGELFGAVELVDEDGQHAATIKAQTPMEIFEIDAELLFDYLRQEGLEESVTGMWRKRPTIAKAGIFRRLDAAAQNRIARTARVHKYAAGEVIIAQGQLNDDFFLLSDGEVEVESAGKVVATINGNDGDNFFGVTSAIHPNRPRRVSVRAKSNVEVLCISGERMRDLFARDMHVRYTVQLALSAR